MTVLFVLLLAIAVAFLTVVLMRDRKKPADKSRQRPKR